ncbi:RDD family protein [Sphingomonas parva]|uniref:RDD family protein n=2 Tax=Sphingomonas parva TaxID=2555898 RepID=A0A4Y8ZW49_9SPHN|nr:RDD family protein [Sphingomonas parva]
MRRRLVTPEGVDLGLTLASAGQRATAFLLDALIMFATLIAMTLIVAFGFMATGLAGAEPLAIIWLLGYFLLRNFYFIILEMGPRAATFGKRASGLRVVARDGGRLTADAVIARNLMREIEVYLPLSFLGMEAAEGGAGAAMTLLGLGWACLFLFFPLFNKDRLRVGDLLAGTWVINTPRQRLTYDLMRADAHSAGYAFTDEQLDAYGIFELQTLEQVLRGGNQDSLDAVATTIRGKLGIGEVESHEAFLTAYYEALRRRLERKLLFGRRRLDKFDR